MSAQVSAVVRHIRKLVTARDDHKLPDDLLLKRFALRQDEAAFAVLVKRHGSMVLSVCRSILHDLHDAEDSFQAAFLLLAQKAPSIRRRQALSGWLYRVAYHVSMRAKVKSARTRLLEKRAVTMPSSDPLLDLSLREVRAMLFEEVDCLAEKYRSPLVLCGLQEKSLEEAARILGLSKGAVKGRLQRGRELLRVRLRRRGLELPIALFTVGFSLNSASGQVSAMLAASTVRAAMRLAAGGHGTAGVVSAEVAALVRGTGMTMFLSKAKIATALVLAVGVAAITLGTVLRQSPASDRPATQRSQAEPPRVRRHEPRPAADAVATIEVRGRVVDSDGKPVSGARLYLDSPGFTEMEYPVRATSRADGRFRFTIPRSELDQADRGNAPPQVMAAAEGHGCNWTPIAPAGEELTLRLVRDLPINGRILDIDGVPVRGAKLTVFFVSAAKGEDLGDYLKAVRKGEEEGLVKFWRGPIGGQPAVLTTSQDGRFRLAGAGRERVVTLRVEGPGIALSSFNVMTRVGEPVKNPRRHSEIYGASFTFVGGPTRPIGGVVRDKETGQPLAGVSVGAPSSVWLKTVTDREGRYELRGWAKKPDYALVATPSDGLHFQRLVHAQDTPGLGVLSCDIELARWLMVRGRVTDKETGKPVAGAQVDYHPLGGNTYVNKLLPGSWEPRAEAATGPDGSYAITVLPGPGVIGVKGPRLEAYMPASCPLQERKEFFKTPLVDRDEDFLTRAAGGGSHGAISPGFYNTLVLLEPKEKEEALVRDVALERPQERKGRVIGPDDKPLAGVTVYGLVRFGIETLKADEFTVRGVNPRAKRPLVFHHKEKNLGFYLNDLRGQTPGPITVKLQPCGSAAGRIVNQDGQPVAGMYVHVLGNALRITGEAGGGYQRVTTNKDGRFHVEGLVPRQEYSVREFSDQPRFPRFYAAVVVEPGQHKDMGDIKMTPRNQ
jgi:RNA polymerase sigma factor (sigma-70 family)